MENIKRYLRSILSVVILLLAAYVYMTTNRTTPEPTADPVIVDPGSETSDPAVTPTPGATGVGSSVAPGVGVTAGSAVSLPGSTMTGSAVGSGVVRFVVI